MSAELLALLPYIALLACPAMMFWMMMGGGGCQMGGGGKGEKTAGDASDQGADAARIAELEARIARMEAGPGSTALDAPWRAEDGAEPEMENATRMQGKASSNGRSPLSGSRRRTAIDEVER